MIRQTFGTVKIAQLFTIYGVLAAAVLMLSGCHSGQNQVSQYASTASAKNGRALSESLSSSFQHCADENGFCTFSGTMTIRYGANGTYATGTFTNGVSCSNSIFGDPIIGVYKSCDIVSTVDVAPATGPTFVHCADENGFCTFSGTMTIRYGANGTYATGTFTNGVSCSNSIFGDPVVGVYKSCDIVSGSIAAPPPPVSTPVPPVATPVPNAMPQIETLATGAVINIINSANNLCLSNYTDAAGDGAPQSFETCSGANRQKYQLSADPGGIFSLKIASSPAICIDIPYASATSGTLLQQYSCNGTAAQSFRAVPSGSGYSLVSVSNSLCLDGTRSDGRLQQYPCSGAATQRFYLSLSGAAQVPPPAATPVAPVAGSLAGSPTGAGFNKGMAVGLYYLNPSELAIAVADLKSMGTTWVRMEFPWNLIQPDNANSFNLDAWDRSVQACNNAGIRVLGLIDYTPQWARAAGTNQFYPPSNLNDFATYSAFLAKRYGPMGVHTWEIWNEENGQTFYKPGPNPSQYVELLKGAYTAIKAVDSGSMVLLGGMATFGDDGINQNARTFLANVYAAGGQSYFDAVAFHPYVYPELPSTSIYNNWGQMAAAPSSLRSIMIANGDGGKKIWMTEFGYPTFPNGAPALTESGQAAYLQQAYELQASYDWAGPLFWYTYHDSTSPNPANPEDHFGLLRADGSQKPAYQIYKSLPK